MYILCFHISFVLLHKTKEITRYLIRGPNSSVDIVTSYVLEWRN
jgi:hypothetical protein